MLALTLLISIRETDQLREFEYSLESVWKFKNNNIWVCDSFSWVFFFFLESKICPSFWQNSSIFFMFLKKKIYEKKNTYSLFGSNSFKFHSMSFNEQTCSFVVSLLLTISFFPGLGGKFLTPTPPVRIGGWLATGYWFSPSIPSIRRDSSNIDISRDIGATKIRVSFKDLHFLQFILNINLYYYEYRRYVCSFQIISKTLSVLFHSLLCTSDGLKNVLRRKRTDRKNPIFWRENSK